MKRPVRGSGGSSNSKLLSSTTPPSLSPSTLEELNRVLNAKSQWQQATPVLASAGGHFEIISSADDVGSLHLNASRPAIAADDLGDEAELDRLKLTIQRITSIQQSPLVLVAGFGADRPARSAAASKLRRDLEGMGAIFVERPQDANMPEKLAAFLEREYAPDLLAIAAARMPLPPMTIRADVDIAPYLEPRPDIPGDHYFLSHHRPSAAGKKP